ncbi:hypothetical protein F5144DRAFT_230202 [Chaetomium tenue]|uniref:Uncharacterized protein n=1 Tax=Chaetomium tenue TaxID=1854479 RepID=A0ACB7P6C4_9PEZI|nr:hypothetical protein F5144DRAFT_230202 [Chaetomium globosum]
MHDVRSTRDQSLQAYWRPTPKWASTIKQRDVRSKGPKTCMLGSLADHSSPNTGPASALKQARPPPLYQHAVQARGNQRHRDGEQPPSGTRSTHSDVCTWEIENQDADIPRTNTQLKRCGNPPPPEHEQTERGDPIPHYSFLFHQPEEEKINPSAARAQPTANARIRHHWSNWSVLGHGTRHQFQKISSGDDFGGHGRMTAVKKKRKGSNQTKFQR